MSGKKKAKVGKAKRFANVDNNPYAVPLLKPGHYLAVSEMILTANGPLLKIGGTVFHLDSNEEEISVFDYGKDLKAAFCNLVGIKKDDLIEYGQQALDAGKLVEAKKLLTQHGYQVAEPMA